MPIYSMVRERHTKDGRGASRFDVEITRGEEIFRDGNEWRRVYRLVDRANDRYVELIVAADGTVVNLVNEPLSQHRGHGAAKQNDKSQREDAAG